MSGSSGGATCPPARSSRSSRSGSIDQIARRCESSRQPEQLSVLPTNVGACSYTTSWDLTPEPPLWISGGQLRGPAIASIRGPPDSLLSPQSARVSGRRRDSNPRPSGYEFVGGAPATFGFRIPEPFQVV